MSLSTNLLADDPAAGEARFGIQDGKYGGQSHVEFRRFLIPE